MKNKKAVSVWGIEITAKLVLLLIILIIIILGPVVYLFYSHENVGGVMDGILIMLRIKESPVEYTGDCSSINVDFEVLGRKKGALFEICYSENQLQCNLKNFPDGTSYTYLPENVRGGLFAVQRPGQEEKTILRPLNLNEDQILNNLIYYKSIEFIYNLFNVNGEENYNVLNYIDKGMDNYFGKFSNLLILVDDSSRTRFFMTANDRYIVHDVTKTPFTETGISLSDITPLTRHSRIIYSGSNSQIALNHFFDIAKNQKIIYFICKPHSVNIVYENCILLENSRLDTGDFVNLLNDQFNLNYDSSIVLDEPLLYHLRRYISSMNSKTFLGKTGFDRPATEFRSLLKEKEMNSFILKDKKYIINGEISPNPKTNKLPVIEIKSSEGNIYYLRFTGHELYRDEGSNFFLNQEVIAPFSLYDENLNEIEINRRGFIDEKQIELDKIATQYLKERCR